MFLQVNAVQFLFLAFRMGYALALGALPKFMISEKLKTILGRLITCSKISQNDQLMAESRRDAVKAITR